MPLNTITDISMAVFLFTFGVLVLHSVGWLLDMIVCAFEDKDYKQAILLIIFLMAIINGAVYVVALVLKETGQ